MQKGKKAKADAIKPPFNVKYPAPSFRDRDTIILSHIPLATKIVGKYVRKYGRKLQDDFFSAAMLGLAKGADSIINGTHENDEHRTSCLASFVHGEITNYLRMTWIIYVPRSACHKPDLPEVYPLMHEIPVEDSIGFALDDLLMLADNETERSVLSLKAQGFDDSEIASVLGVSAITVWRTRIALRERYNRVENE